MKKHNLLGRCICLVVIASILFFLLYGGHFLCSLISRFNLTDWIFQLKENLGWIFLGVFITLISDSSYQKYLQRKNKKK